MKAIFPILHSTIHRWKRLRVVRMAHGYVGCEVKIMLAFGRTIRAPTNDKARSSEDVLPERCRTVLSGGGKMTVQLQSRSCISNLMEACRDGRHNFRAYPGASSLRLALLSRPSPRFPGGGSTASKPHVASTYAP